MELHLDARETELLLHLLERRIDDLQREINHTDRAAFKAGLKADLELTRHLLHRVKTPALMGI